MYIPDNFKFIVNGVEYIAVKKNDSVIVSWYDIDGKPQYTVYSTTEGFEKRLKVWLDSSHDNRIIWDEDSLPEDFTFHNFGTLYRAKRDDFGCYFVTQVSNINIHVAQWNREDVLRNVNDGTWTEVTPVDNPVAPQSEVAWVLPHTFYFKLNAVVCGRDDTVFFAASDEEGGYNVSWKHDESGSRESTHYKKEYVENYIKSLTWLQCTPEDKTVDDFGNTWTQNTESFKFGESEDSQSPEELKLNINVNISELKVLNEEIERLISNLKQLKEIL